MVSPFPRSCAIHAPLGDRPPRSLQMLPDGPSSTDKASPAGRRTAGRGDGRVPQVRDKRGAGNRRAHPARTRVLSGRVDVGQPLRSTWMGQGTPRDAHGGKVVAGRVGPRGMGYPKALPRLGRWRREDITDVVDDGARACAYPTRLSRDGPGKLVWGRPTFRCETAAVSPHDDGTED